MKLLEEDGGREDRQKKEDDERTRKDDKTEEEEEVEIPIVTSADASGQSRLINEFEVSRDHSAIV